MQTHHYSTQTTRISASLVVSIFITLHGRWHEIGRALVTPTFYLAVFISFCIAYLLMYIVHLVTSVLDRKYPVNKRSGMRILIQICACVLMPALLDVLLMYFYFKALGIDMFKTTYLLVDFPIVLILLLFLNVFYLLISSLRSRKKISRDVLSEVLAIDYNGVHVKLDVATDIVFFYRDRKLIKVYTVSGKEYPLKDTIGNLAKRFNTICFCQINPSAIINLNAIQGYTSGTNRDTLLLLFQDESQNNFNAETRFKLRVTKEYIGQFKQKLDSCKN